MTGIQVYKRRDRFVAAVFIDRISVLGGIQKDLRNPELRKVCVRRIKGPKNSIPDESPIPSCSLAGNKGVCHGRKGIRLKSQIHFLYCCAAVRTGAAHWQEPDASD